MTGLPVLACCLPASCFRSLPSSTAGRKGGADDHPIAYPVLGRRESIAKLKLHLPAHLFQNQVPSTFPRSLNGRVKVALVREALDRLRADRRSEKAWPSGAPFVLGGPVQLSLGGSISMTKVYGSDRYRQVEMSPPSTRAKKRLAGTRGVLYPLPGAPLGAAESL
ncbi:hypothetical protein BJ166DRAFT_493323 [Pestalotiopsis sp. NC0098]|nr:hypothetical protein BJ166DRAFT_493323 [Pestalotiopsis sp. NC0098]